MSNTEIDSARFYKSNNNLNDENSFSYWENSKLEVVPSKYLRVSERSKSFGTSWRKYYINTLDLAKAGFYFLAEPDRVKCFSCHLILGDWCITDDPWIEHAFWNPKCQHVKDKRGEDYIREVNKNWSQHCRI